LVRLLLPHALIFARDCRFTPPRFCLAPKPPLPASGEGIKGWGKSTWDKRLNVIVDTNGI
jgi:hypothetical protein